MAKRCEDEFNPWPSFVDIFSSVILVMLLFLLVLLVSLGYYAQFKFKVSYTGTIATDDLILNSNPDSTQTSDKLIRKLHESSKSQSQSESQSESQSQSVQQMQAEIIRLKKIIEEKTVKAKEKEEAEVKAGGIDVNDVDDDDDTKQELIKTDDYFIVTYKGNEIFLEAKTSKDLENFIKEVQDKYKEHKVLITASDVKGQASATVAKQISLARSIGARNLIRKFGYDKKDVRIDLLAETEVKEQFNKDNGYLVIRIKK